jgi:alpha 1,3-glucosidase
MAQYASLTGTTLLPARFALGYHQCKWNYKSEAEIDELDANFDLHNIPYDVSWLDIEHTDGKRYMTWDKTYFPDPKRMIDKVASKGRRMVTIVDPHLKRDAGYSVHDAASKAGHYIKDRTGNEYDGWCWPGSSSWPDFLSASVRNWWASLLDYKTYVGSTPSLMIWNDMNEPSVFNGPEVTMHKDALHHNGWEHRDVHNLYGMMVQAATHQGLLSRNADSPTRDFVLSRALFAGTQRLGAVWTGDNAAEWSHLRASTPMVLSLGIAGVAFSGADVGGFFGNPDGELLARWLQVGAYQPFFRGHAHLDSKRREPWVFPEPFLSAQREAIRARYAIMPYLYTTFHEASQTGVPVMRPLWMEFPAAAQLFAEEDEFMLGSALLVVPVSQAGGSSVEVRFPAGSFWYRFDASLKRNSVGLAGGASVEEAALASGAPVWQRGGTIVPKMERVRRSTHQQMRDPVTLVVALDEHSSAEGSLFWDDGLSIYGSFMLRRLVFADGALRCQRDSSVESGALQKDGWGLLVERIRVAGLTRPPTSVNIENVPLQFEWTEGGVLVIRRPQVSLDKDWTIQIA